MLTVGGSLRYITFSLVPYIALHNLPEYVASARWRPVPLFVDSTPVGWGADGALGGGGPRRIRAEIETNPQLKSPLQVH